MQRAYIRSGDEWVVPPSLYKGWPRKPSLAATSAFPRRSLARLRDERRGPAHGCSRPGNTVATEHRPHQTLLKRNDRPGDQSCRASHRCHLDGFVLLAAVEMERPGEVPTDLRLWPSSGAPTHGGGEPRQVSRAMRDPGGRPGFGCETAFRRAPSPVVEAPILIRGGRRRSGPPVLILPWGPGRTSTMRCARVCGFRKAIAPLVACL
jgi:hypothetical protein